MDEPDRKRSPIRLSVADATEPFILMDSQGHVLVHVYLWDNAHAWWVKAELTPEVEASIGELVGQALAGKEPGIRFFLPERGVTP